MGSCLEVSAGPPADARAWTAATIDDRTAWYYRLPDCLLAALDQTVSALRRNPPPTTQIPVSDSACAVCGEDLVPVVDTLERGRGFVIIDGLPSDRYSVEEAQSLYWLIGQLVGHPVEQNVQGALLYDVRDTGKDVKQGARFSVTNAESTFHTDNSFGEKLADYVGLLCLRPAKSGGLNQVVSAYSVHNELAGKHPKVLEMLCGPFHVDRRGGVREGEAATVRVPILQWDPRGLVCRYLRYWIEVGHEKAGEPLTAEQVKSLDVLDDVLRRPDLRVEFALMPGQMFFINNRSILHNRTAFEDHPEPDRRRHLVRLWLKAK